MYRNTPKNILFWNTKLKIYVVIKKEKKIFIKTSIDFEIMNV